MRPTLDRTVRTKKVGDDELQVWAALEVIPFMLDVKRVLDQVYQTAKTITTPGNGTFTTIYSTPDLAVGVDWMIEARVMAHTSSDRSSWIIEGLFFNDGTVQQEGVTFALYTQTAAACDVRFLVVDNHIDVQVQDDGIPIVEFWQWKVWINLRENP